MILSWMSFWARWIDRVGHSRRPRTLCNSGLDVVDRPPSGPARKFAAPTASWIARLMPIPPTGDMPGAASPIGGEPDNSSR